MIKTKYTYWAYLPLILILALIPLFYVLISMRIENSPLTLYFLLCGILIVWFWLLIIELGRKVVSVSINGHSIIIVNFLGFRFSKVINFNSTDGFKTATINSDWEKF